MPRGRGAGLSAGCCAVLVLLAACAGGTPSSTSGSPSSASGRPSSSSTPAVPSLPVPGPVGLAVVGDAVWAASPDDGTVGPLPDGPRARVGPTALRLATDGRGTVWATALGSGDVVAVDAATGSA